MKKSKFTEQQIAFALKQAENGISVEEVCRKMGISDATFYNWKKKYGGVGVSELRRLRQLEEENSKLMITELVLIFHVPVNPRITLLLNLLTEVLEMSV